VCSRLQKEIPLFLEKEAERILAMNPKIVGFSVMTQQKNATFAMCHLLKQKNPDIITIMGGGICVGETAKQFLKHIPDLDYVFTGEGDRALGRACKALLEGQSLEDHPYLLSRSKEPSYYIVNDLDDNPVPDFSDYTRALEEDEFRDKIDKKVTVESSRGCWWAATQRCRFCGLHYCMESTCYREKSPEKFWKEVDVARKELGFTEFQLADCIISRRLINSLPDTCPKEREDMVFFAECRSDLSEADIKKLAANRFVQLQPGIESLQDDVLKLMNKGRKTVQQLLFLRRCLQYGIKPVWNIIYAIPGEKDSWYEEMLLLMKKIHHLKPPASVRPMLLARGSIFHTHAAEYGIGYGLRLIEKACSPDDVEYQMATADYFTYTAPRLSETLEVQLLQEYRSWNNDFYNNKVSLICSFGEEKATVTDNSNPSAPRSYEITGLKSMILKKALDICTLDRMSKELNVEISDIEAEALELEELGILYRKGDDLLCLACPT
jgi:magnesium-protoporphyrin IX monomethyl ester (oxidative) cyclase